MDSLWIYLILIFIFIGRALIRNAGKQVSQPVDDKAAQAAKHSHAFEQKVRELMQAASKKNPQTSFMPERPVEAEPSKYTPSIETLHRDTPRPVVNDNNYASVNETTDFESVENLRRAIIISEILNRKY